MTRPFESRDAAATPVKITRAHVCEGHTGCDHLISDTAHLSVELLVGETYASEAEARAAAEAAYLRVCDPRVRSAKIYVEVGRR